MAPSPDRRVLLLGVGIPIAALVAVVAITVIDEGGEPRVAPPTSTTVADSPVEPAVDERWNAQLAELIEPLRGTLPTYVRDVESWSSGSLAAQELEQTLDRVDDALADVEAAAQALPAHPSDDLARPLVRDVAALYRLAVRAHRAALAAGDPDVVEQYDRLARRLRVLADRTFDRARERTAEAIETGEDVRLVLPAEVPDWSRFGLSAGPPLEDRDSDRPDELPLEREERRDAQPERDWRAQVDRLEVPTAAEVQAARTSADRLGELARRLIAAADALRGVPVPAGDRGRADRVAIGWLVLADAARAAQLDAITGTTAHPLADRLLEVAAGPSFRVG